MSISTTAGCCESPQMADIRSGRCQQVWFVSEENMLALPARITAQFGNAETPTSNIPATGVDAQQQEQQQQLFAMIMQQQARTNLTSLNQQKATKSAVAFRTKAGT
uniref:Uncharacterized protein n=1 Tax=Pseudictyota dubia TaxID=2749911 RepID=A0A7R9VY86_9STRA